MKQDSVYVVVPKWEIGVGWGGEIAIEWGPD
jgi:hypothetical protein